MKSICFLFSFYILCLSCVPCLDANECDNENITNVFSDTPTNEHQHHTTETCSPFCICACCGSQCFNIQISPIIKNIEKQHIKTTFPFYKLFFAGDFTSQIWQPPKVS